MQLSQKKYVHHYTSLSAKHISNIKRHNNRNIIHNFFNIHPKNFPAHPPGHYVPTFDLANKVRFASSRYTHDKEVHAKRGGTCVLYTLHFALGGSYTL